MKRRTYKYIAAIVFIVLVGTGYYLYQSRGQDGRNQRYRTVKVSRGDIRTVVTATGTINPVITVLVGSQVSGTIKALYADFNSRVQQGQVIAQIDPAIFQAQVEQARANVLNAEASLLNVQSNLKNVQANVAKAQVAVDDTKRTLERNRPLLEQKVISQATFDTSLANYDSAVAQAEATKAQLESAKAQIESSKAQVAQTKAALKLAEINLGYTTIRSPVNGIVILRNVDVGQTVAASLQAPTLFTIAQDLTKMQVDSNVSEADVGRITVGQDVTFTVDAYPEMVFPGRVSEIRNAPTTIQNVVTYNVVIQVDNSELKLKPGMTANVSVLIEHKEGVLRVSNSALRFRPEFAKREDGGPKAKQGEAVTPKKQTKDGEPSKGQTPMERLTKELGLTEEQQTKIQPVLAALGPEIREIRERAKPDEARNRIRMLLREKIWGFLTDEQKQKFAEVGPPPSQAQAGGRRRAQVWTLASDGKPVPVPIMLGVTDGTFSEVASGELKEGSEVIVEDTLRPVRKGQAQGGPPPFMRGMGK